MTDFAAATADAAGSASRLDSLLAGLAAKTRVHELAKRVGISSRLLMATLAEQGVTVKSTSSSVDTAAARAALTTLSERGEFTPPPSDQPALDVGPVETPAAADVPTADEVTPVGEAAATVPAEPAPSPVTEPAPWAPLFAEAVAPPAPAASASVASAPTASDEVAADARFDDLPPRLRVHELAKRAGVSAKVMIAELADRGIPAKSANSVVAKAVAQDVLSALFTPAQPELQPEADTTEAGTDAAGTDDDRRGRRRRGRRGRGRTDDRADQGPEQDSAEPVSADQDGADNDSADLDAAHEGPADTTTVDPRVI